VAVVAGAGAGASAKDAPAKEAAAPAALDWRAPATWQALASLLAVDGGFVGADAPLTAWLAERMARRRARGARTGQT
jgi:hypothetical protein